MWLHPCGKKDETPEVSVQCITTVHKTCFHGLFLPIFIKGANTYGAECIYDFSSGGKKCLYGYLNSAVLHNQSTFI